jgi:atlastin
MAGRPIQIVVSRDDHSFELDEDALAAVLLQDHVKNMKVVVISVVGALRNGKSFLREIFLRYLTTQGSHGWTEREDGELIARFSWPEGSERDTAGIFIWSEVLVTHLSNGEQVAVILMDVQGAFDSKSAARDCAAMFALSTLLSSVQIIALSYNIEQADLQLLQLIAECGRYAMDDVGHIPFQKLQFVVRNWNLPYLAGYGANGGEVILKRLQLLDEQHPETQSLSEDIRSCFSNISCFFMPHPGLKVATCPDFDGNLPHFEPYFKKQLNKLVTMTLAPENLVVKEIGGQRLRAKEMLQHFKSYLEIYKRNELPGPKTMLSVAEAYNLSAVIAAKETYTALMEEVCCSTKPYLSTAHLEAVHQRIRVKSLQQFVNKYKVEGQNFSEPYKEKLDKELQDLYEQFRMKNKSKNFKEARTPAVFFATAVMCHILSGIFGCVGIYSLPIICNLMMVNAILSLGIWAYAWNNGQMREIKVYLDEEANILRDIVINLTVLWDNVVKRIYQHFSEMSLNRLRCMLQNRPENSSPCIGLKRPEDHVHQNQVQQDGKTEEANVLWDNVEKSTTNIPVFLGNELRLHCMLQNEPESSSPCVGLNCPRHHVQQGISDEDTPQEHFTGVDRTRQ